MTTPRDLDTALEAIKTSMAAQLPHRVVSRSLLLDPMSADEADLRKGVLCLVNGGGGKWANYLGREGQLGQANLSIVGFVLVDEASAPVDVERAELALLDDVLGWVHNPGLPRPVNSVLPLEFRQSGQLEHPFGWMVLTLNVKP